MDSVLMTQDDAILAIEEAYVDMAIEEVNSVCPIQLGVDPSKISISYDQEIFRPTWPRFVLVPARVNLKDLLSDAAAIAASKCAETMFDSIQDVFGEVGLNQFLSHLLSDAEP